MSKATDTILLVPGATGWEIWTRAAGSAPVLAHATGNHSAGEITDLPPGDVLMLFPAKAATALPLQVASTDEALFSDLATMHAERLGLRTDPMAGQLSDTFPVFSHGDSTALLNVILKAPAEGELPVRGPKQFDLSARAYSHAGDTAAVWREFDRWVFAFYHGGKLLYFQATSNDSPAPDDSLAREIRFSLAQLGIQGIGFTPARLLVWEDTEVSALQTLRVPVEIHPKPAPFFPDPPSRLLPADVRAARREAEKKRNITLGIAALTALYLGLLGWFGYGVWKTNSETKELKRLAAEAAPEGERYTNHIARWDELATAIDLKNNPVDIMLRITSSIPPNSGLRLKNADVSASEIKLTGEAPTPQAVNTFNLRLTKHNDLAHFTWQTPQPSQSTRGWEFSFTADVPATTP